MLPFTNFSFPRCSRYEFKIYEVRFTLIRFCRPPPSYLILLPIITKNCNKQVTIDQNQIYFDNNINKCSPVLIHSKDLAVLKGHVHKGRQGLRALGEGLEAFVTIKANKPIRLNGKRGIGSIIIQICMTQLIDNPSFEIKLTNFALHLMAD